MANEFAKLYRLLKQAGPSQEPPALLRRPDLPPAPQPQGGTSPRPQVPTQPQPAPAAPARSATPSPSAAQQQPRQSMRTTTTGQAAGATTQAAGQQPQQQTWAYWAHHPDSWGVTPSNWRSGKWIPYDPTKDKGRLEQLKQQAWERATNWQFLSPDHVWRINQLVYQDQQARALWERVAQGQWHGTWDADARDLYAYLRQKDPQLAAEVAQLAKKDYDKSWSPWWAPTTTSDVPYALQAGGYLNQVDQSDGQGAGGQAQQQQQQQQGFMSMLQSPIGLLMLLLFLGMMGR